MPLTPQVSHHPPAAAHHVISQRGWTLWQHITIDSKFRGKYISVMPLGKIFSPSAVQCEQRQFKALAAIFPDNRSSLHQRKHPPAVPLQRKPLRVEQSDVDGAQHHRGETVDRPGELIWHLLD